MPLRSVLHMHICRPSEEMSGVCRLYLHGNCCHQWHLFSRALEVLASHTDCHYKGLRQGSLQGANLVAAAKPLFTPGSAKWSLRFSMGPLPAQSQLHYVRTIAPPAVCKVMNTTPHVHWNCTLLFFETDISGAHKRAVRWQASLWHTTHHTRRWANLSGLQHRAAAHHIWRGKCCMWADTSLDRTW